MNKRYRIEIQFFRGRPMGYLRVAQSDWMNKEEMLNQTEEYIEGDEATNIDYRIIITCKNGTQEGTDDE